MAETIREEVGKTTSPMWELSPRALRGTLLYYFNYYYFMLMTTPSVPGQVGCTGKQIQEVLKELKWDGRKSKRP